MKDNAKLNFKSNERSDFADFNCHWWSGNFVSAHSHEDYYEISIVTDGTLFNKINGTNLKQEVKDVILIKPEVSHSIIADTKTNSRHYNIAITRRYFENFIHNKNSVKNALIKNNFIHHKLSDNAYNFIYDVINKIDNLSYNFINYTLVECVLYSIIAEIIFNENYEENFDKISNYCNDAINKINNYSYISMQATEIYKLYPVSHTAFIKEFKNITGKTLVSFLQSKKLDYAKTLLTTTNYSILEISSLLNYDSLSYFIRIFKAEYGLTPFQYRKNNVGDIYN